MSIFSETIELNEKTKDKALRPLVLKTNQADAMDKVIHFLEANGFTVDDISKDFYEVFAFEDERELTFSFVNDGGKTSVGIVLFTKRHKFSKKKYLLKLVEQLKQELKNYLI